ncbi:MAG: hypothetical protein ABIH17_13305 [Pseudomonadota bacterium]
MSSAVIDLAYDGYGRMVCRIEHELLRGVSPQMLAWWFRNLGGDTELEGRRLAKYLVWHPTDHSHWELVSEAPEGGAGVGARFRIVEAFNGNRAYTIDVTEEVLRLDDEGLTLVNRPFGVEVTRLNHDFIAAEGGTLYRSTLTVGVALPLVGRLINAFLYRFVFTEDMGRAWLRHNVEEVGALEHILPLFGDAGSTPKPSPTT